MMRHSLRILVMVQVVWCASVALGAEVPAEADPIEIAYGEHERQRLDFYPCPAADSDTPSALLLYFHGGGFRHGDKSGVSKNLIKRMHDKGISVAAVNYRFITTDALPAAMLDGARSVQFMRHHAAEYHLDAERFAVLGSSAGAGISLWIALHDDLADPEAEDEVARVSSRVVCAYVKNAQVSYDPRFWRELGLVRVFERRTFHELYRYADDAEAGEVLLAMFEEASPITHLSADDPPIRLDYGYGLELDDQTPMSALIHHPLHGVAFQEACEPVGVECELSYKGGPKPGVSGYGYLIQKLSK